MCVCVFNLYLVAFFCLRIVINLWLFIAVLTLHEELVRMCQNYAFPTAAQAVQI